MTHDRSPEIVKQGGVPAPEAKHYNSPEWKRLEYAELNQAGRTLYSAYYSLATMSFTWNASLGTATAVLVFYGSERCVGGALYLFGALLLSILATIYNIGAGTGFVFIARQFRVLADAFGSMRESSGLQIPALLFRMMGGNSETGEGHTERRFGIIGMTKLFFGVLTAIWLLVFAFALAALLQRNVDLGLPFLDPACVQAEQPDNE